MKLIMLRHGESIGNTKRGYISGRGDPDGLTVRGRSQIIRASYELRHEKITHILASPVTRAQESAKIFSLQHKRKITTCDFLTELHHGVFEGKYWWEVIDQIPMSWKKTSEDFNTPYPGQGESMQMLLERVWIGLSEIEKKYKDKKVLIVSHQAVIAALRYLLIYGNPSFFLDSEAKIAEFLHYIHNTKLDNGAYVSGHSEGSTMKDIRESEHLKPVLARRDNARFYFRGVFNSHKMPDMRTKITASGNSVYEVFNNQTLLLKILHDKDSESSCHQATLHAYLLEKKIPAAKIIYLDNSEIYYEYPVLIQEYIKGHNQGKCLRAHPTAQLNFIREVFEYLKKIHELPIDEVKGFWVSPGEKQFRSFQAFMLLNINLTLRYFHVATFRRKSRLTVVSKLLLLRKYIEGRKYRRVPLHGDVAPENIIATHLDGRCKLACMIDFERVRIGDPIWDFAYYLGWLERDNMQVAGEWNKLVSGSLSSKDTEILELYRVLFHAWTVRDMHEYRGSRIRKRRGMRSREILVHDFS